MMIRPRPLFAVLLILLLFNACSSEPPKPAATAGTTYNDAKNNLKALDYEAARKNLDKTIKMAGTEPLAGDARVALIAMSFAEAHGARLLADAYDIGGRQPAAQAMTSQFRRTRTDYYTHARAHLLMAMEDFVKQRATLSDAALPVSIEFPEFAGNENPAVNRIREGTYVADNDKERAEREAIRNEMARLMARMTGAGDDVHKGHSTFQKGNVQLDPRLYQLAVAQQIIKLSEIYAYRALDDSRGKRTALEVARDTVDNVAKMLAAKPDKDIETQAKKLKADIEKELKKLS
jgi:hypothetical protein